MISKFKNILAAALFVMTFSAQVMPDGPRRAGWGKVRAKVLPGFDPQGAGAKAVRVRHGVPETYPEAFAPEGLPRQGIVVSDSEADFGPMSRDSFGSFSGSRSSASEYVPTGIPRSLGEVSPPIEPAIPRGQREPTKDEKQKLLKARIEVARLAGQQKIMDKQFGHFEGLLSQPEGTIPKDLATQSRQVVETFRGQLPAEVYQVPQGRPSQLTVDELSGQLGELEAKREQMARQNKKLRRERKNMVGLRRDLTELRFHPDEYYAKKLEDLDWLNVAFGGESTSELALRSRKKALADLRSNPDPKDLEYRAVHFGEAVYPQPEGFELARENALRLLKKEADTKAQEAEQARQAFFADER